MHKYRVLWKLQTAVMAVMLHGKDRAVQDEVEVAIPEWGLHHKQWSLTFTLCGSNFWQERTTIVFVFYKDFSATV